MTSEPPGSTALRYEGKFHFRDVTKASGCRTPSGSWTTAITLATVNGDGTVGHLYLSCWQRRTPAPRQ